MIGPIRERYQCQSCGMLWMQEEVAMNCCYPDKVFLCGKRRRGPYGTTSACTHFDKADARHHQKTDGRRKSSKLKGRVK